MISGQQHIIPFDRMNYVRFNNRTPAEEKEGDKQVAEGVLKYGSLEFRGKLPGKKHGSPGKWRVHHAKDCQTGSHKKKESRTNEALIDQGGEAGCPNEANQDEPAREHPNGLQFG